MISKQLRKRIARQTAAPAARCAYECEALEPRLLLSVFTINGTAGDDTIVLSTRIHFIPPGTTQDLVTYSINGSATQSIVVTPGSDSIQLDTGTGVDTVSVLSTFPNVPTAITGHSTSAGPDDTLTVGNAGSIQGINGSISANNPPGMWNITVDDSSDTTRQNLVITDSASVGSLYLRGVGPGALSVSWSDLDTRSMTLQTGPNPQGDSFGVANGVSVSGNSVPIHIVGHNPDPTAAIHDSVGIGPADTIPIPPAPREF